MTGNAGTPGAQFGTETLRNVEFLQVSRPVDGESFSSSETYLHMALQPHAVSDPFPYMQGMPVTDDGSVTLIGQMPSVAGELLLD